MAPIRLPRLIRCGFDKSVGARPSGGKAPEPSAGTSEQTWSLPQGLHIVGASPRRFRITIERRRRDAYRVRLIWNRSALTWASVTRADLLGSDIASLLRIHGTELWHLLNQPVKTGSGRPGKAA